MMAAYVMTSGNSVCHFQSVAWPRKLTVIQSDAFGNNIHRWKTIIDTGRRENVNRWEYKQIVYETSKRSKRFM